ncbi:MAG: hypothetical protein P8Y28_03515 [Gammaproteobacteria bacterium]|jgi:hypothetical protein
MGNESLQKLSQDYAIGQIDRYSYRQQRARLIDEITGYQVSLHNSSTTTQSENGSNQQITGSSGSVAASYIAKIVAIATLLIAIILMTIFLTNNSDNNNRQVNSTSQIAPRSAEILVSTFVQYDDWTSERVSQFVAGWQRLTDLQRLEAKQAAWFQGLVETMKKRLLNLQNNANSDDAEQKAQSIKNLADLLGIRL